MCEVTCKKCGAITGIDPNMPNEFTCHNCAVEYIKMEGHWYPVPTKQIDPTEGRKYDKEKDRWDLVLWREFCHVVKVLTLGAIKYAPENWKYVKDARNRYFAAAHRHLYAWRKGEIIDSETSLPHLAHAICCLLFLMWFDEEDKKKKQASLEMCKKIVADAKQVCKDFEDADK